MDAGTTNVNQIQFNQPIDNSIYVYEIPRDEQGQINNFLDRNDTWREAAVIMGYLKNDIKEFQQLSHQEQRSPTEIMLSYWGDQGNHTVTELFMVLNRLQQYEAMDCLKSFVDQKYHRLLYLSQLNSNDDRNYSNEQNQSGIPNVENDMPTHIPHVPYADILISTDNWAKDRKLGSGGYGCVYSGIWKNTQYAFKRIKFQGSAQDSKAVKEIDIKQSKNEIRYLNSCRHDNVLALYGYSIDGKERCLVYQYMDGGSLEGRLHHTGVNKEYLSFKQRCHIAVGTARGLQYLHTFNVKPLIHGDIKPANILLDRFCSPKIGDFGLARECSIESMKVSQAYGTKPYLAKELWDYRTLSTKVDTYSYGVVIFEMFSGLRAYSEEREDGKKYLTEYIWSFEHQLELTKTLIDGRLMVNEEVDEYLFLDLMEIGLECTRKEAQRRPEMRMVLTNLETKISCFF